MGKPSKLILLRHGQSEWNKLNLFTGWVDVPLSQGGIQEALEAGKRLAQIPIDLIYVSTLMRAQMTAMLAMSVHQSGKVPVRLHANEGKLGEWAQIYSKETEKSCIPVRAAWELNERMYGELQGLNKRETMDKFGEEQVKIWRRSYDVAPPGGESLEMTAARAIPYFEKEIVSQLSSGKNILICAHGNSLRSIIMDLEKLSKEEVLQLELATGVPLIYHYCDGKWEKEKS
jgi:2,3-bisphosphoglycerate-dependent phosphoglycerate mutase